MMKYHTSLLTVVLPFIRLTKCYDKIVLKKIALFGRLKRQFILGLDGMVKGMPRLLTLMKFKFDVRFTFSQNKIWNKKRISINQTVDNNLPHFSHFYKDLTVYIFIVCSLVMKALSVIYISFQFYKWYGCMVVT